MSVVQFEKSLNDVQLEAVQTVEGPLLILAGAGSGKTRVITYRIAYLLSKNIHQSSIMAVTFTNKAAKEMSGRIRELTRKRLSNLTISTFHALGVKILKENIDILGYKKNFSIYDQVDKQSLIKEVARETGFGAESLDTYQVANIFSNIKSQITGWTSLNDQFKDLYDEYQAHLKLYNAVDFDDLIMLPIKIFSEKPGILEKYTNQYKYFMVDEFQDTSLTQYQFIKLLSYKSKNLCVVGDDDQSIYSWRGANYENLLRFEKDYPGYREIKLEQNYRSTGRILLVANKLIQNNKNRKAKELWSGAEQGEPIELNITQNERQEGELIAGKIRSLRIRYGLQYRDFGVLVRTNSLTRPIEEAFIKDSLPYHVSGGMSFFQRKEVKDIISYLRVMTNEEDDMNLLRIINIPRRGVGRKTVELLMDTAKSKSCSIYSALAAHLKAANSPLGGKVRGELDEFINTLQYYRHKILSGKNMGDSLMALIEHIDYWDFLLLETKNKNSARWKYMNVESLVNSLADWESDPDNPDPNIYSYLNRITLLSRDDNEAGDEDNKINLMTIHSAKGLEFEVVCIAGTERELIPHQRSVEENDTNVEEERRLFYVAITRAKKKLIMTACKERRKKGKKVETDISPFIDEIPENLIEVNREEEVVDTDAANEYFKKMKARMSQKKGGT
ncbi:MAG: UvrD-helicase domain-containing protein [Spirochaetales bacterium]|nr:UvrD-helicase domain-containing protein [Spirochaetales bacterium]